MKPCNLSLVCDILDRPHLKSFQNPELAPRSLCYTGPNMSCGVHPDLQCRMDSQR